jgi:hypothetical protein
MVKTNLSFRIVLLALFLASCSIPIPKNSYFESCKISPSASKIDTLEPMKDFHDLMNQLTIQSDLNCTFY